MAATSATTPYTTLCSAVPVDTSWVASARRARRSGPSLVGGVSTGSSSVNRVTMAGSNALPASSWSMRIAAAGDMAGRYGRPCVSASKQSATDRMRAPKGICSPLSPAG